jgi:hypothetical protein
MIKKFSFRNLSLLGLVAVLALSLALAVSPASADNGNGEFKIKVKHAINGAALGLDRELPVNINVYKDGELLTTIEDFRFMDILETSLPAGNYYIQVTFPDGTPVPGLELGPVDIPAGADVLVVAALDKNGNPFLASRISGGSNGGGDGDGDGEFKIKVKHAINGARLGLDRELPVNINVYKDGELLTTIEDFRFMDVLETSLPAGNYYIQVTFPDGTPIPGLELGPVDIPAGANVLVVATLDKDGNPTLASRIRGGSNGDGNGNGNGTEDFKVTVKHAINGARLGLDRDLPVNINIYKDGELLTTIEDFRFRETVSAMLPAGNYYIQVTFPDGTPVPGLELGPVDISAGANLVIIARLGPDGPTLMVRDATKRTR